MIQPSDSLATYLKSSGYSGTVNDMLYKYLIDVNGLTFGSISLNDLIYRTLVAWGYSGTLQDMASAFLRATDGAGLASYPRTLFANNEQGAWYDPSDFSTLYQDSGGTTPVTALGQPVGLMLDKRLGLVLGSELVSNGGFDTDTVWVKGTGWSIGSGKASFDPTGQSANSDIYAALSSNKDSAQTADISANGAFTVYLAITAGGGHVKVTGEVSGRTAGTIRVLAASGRVYIRALNGTGFNGSIDNLSVRELHGNHASQSTAASRPTVEARVNLLTYSEQFNNAAWIKSGATISANAEVAPDGNTTADKIVEDTANTVHRAYQTPVLTAGLSYSLGYYVKPAGRSWCYVANSSDSFSAYFDLANVAVGTIIGSGVTASISSVGNGWCLVRINFLAPVTSARTIYCAPATGDGGATYLGDGSSGVYVWGADLRLTSNSAYPYQRVTTATDYADVGAPRYLQADGIDDWMVTNSIDFTGTGKMTVWAGVRKLSDTIAGIVCELSVTAASNAGTFYIRAPNSGGAGNYGFISGGTVRVSVSPSGFTSPITNTITGIGDISGDSIILRVNGVQTSAGSADQGTGNFGNYPLYLLRRGGTSSPFNGRLYGLVIRGAASTTSQIAAGEVYMNGKTRAY